MHKISYVLAIAFSAFLMAACSDGGSDSGSARDSPAVSALPKPTPYLAGKLGVANGSSSGRQGTLAPLSTTDPRSILSSEQIVQNPWKSKGLTDLKLLEMLPEEAKNGLATGKWFKGFLYQSPMNINAYFRPDDKNPDAPGNKDGDISLFNAFAFPNKLTLDDRIGMVAVSFPTRRYVAYNPDPNIVVYDLRNPLKADSLIYEVAPSGQQDVRLTYLDTGGQRFVRRVNYFDELTITTTWQDANATQSMSLIAAEGSPYVTVRYRNLRPMLQAGQGSLPRTLTNSDGTRQIDLTKQQSDNGIQGVAVDEQPMQPFDEAIGAGTPRLTGKKFRFLYWLPNRALAKPGTNDGTIVAEPSAYKEVVFYASTPITLEWDKASRSYVASENFTGVIRTAAVNDVPMADWNNQTKLGISDLPAFKDRRKILDAYAMTFPTKSEITLNHEGGEQATVTFNWKTERMDGQAPQGKDLLMMGFDATHMPSLQNRNPVDGLVYLSNFGTMSANAGDTWTQKLTIPVILRNSPTGENLWLGSGRIKEADKDKLRTYLLRDARLMMGTDPDQQKSYLRNCNFESYYCGKYLHNIARLALIARELGETGLQQELGAYLAKNLKPWFEGIDPSDPGYAGSAIKENILYDTVNNGIITQRAFKDQSQDYYNAWYVDHMFHYGYYIYASAVLATIDPSWLAQNKERVNLLARDIANPSLEDKHFPLMRTYDWFRMQNFADAGPDANGPNTESSSESINANYALALWGAVIGDSSYQALAAIMTAGEIRTAQAFYQITPDSLPLRDAEPVTVTVKLPGGESGTQTMDPTKEMVRNVIRANNSETNVFFGQRLIFRVGIQALPITPISEYVISDKWAKTHEMRLRKLEANETSLFNDAIGRLPTADSDCFLAIYGGGEFTQRTPAEYCTGALRTSYSWRQSIIALNGVNDAQGTYDRYLSYAEKLEEQQRKYIKMTADAFAPQGGVVPDVLKDVSTPTTDTNTLWWLSARKSN
ncbi:hypothetical protein KTQ42_15900|uniref:glycosyl hydrolase n=1 Tax=Noviherbaspirillum sp. L7-7A TaxID=2850560 RepID=UPI001C2C35B8|nr:glycosyl hydrolase [Noviherbaspirillum sp. L7-7A]MBV0880780.1 hypothetical protein [Noviherbaspirillum sp. L7-7A]